MMKWYLILCIALKQSLMLDVGIDITDYSQSTYSRLYFSPKSCVHVFCHVTLQFLPLKAGIFSCLIDVGPGRMPCLSQWNVDGVMVP